MKLSVLNFKFYLFTAILTITIIYTPALFNTAVLYADNSNENTVQSSKTAVSDGTAVQTPETTSEEVLRGVEDRYVGKTSKAAIKMILIDSSGAEKERSLTIYRQKIDNANLSNFQHFHSPNDMMNTTFLVNEKDGGQEKFIYLPSFKKIRKIVSKDNNVRYVSSDFSYEDLDNFHAADYICEKLKEEKYENKDVHVVECKKKNTDSQYSKIIFKISKEKLIPVATFLYDKKNGALIKQIENRKLKKVKNIWTPYEVEMKDVKNSTSTKLLLEKIEYDINLSQDTFTQRNMEK